MTEEQRQHIENKIQSGYTMTSSVCLVAGFHIYRKQFLTFALYALLVPVIGILFTLSGMGLLGTLILVLLISPVLNAGLYLGADQVVKGKSLEYRDFFNILPKAAQLILSNLIATVISALILLPTYYIFENIGMFEWYQSVAANPATLPEPPLMNATQSSTFFLNMVPLLYLQVGFSWAFLFILFYDARPFAALEFSRRLINRRWGAQFMLLLTFVSIFMLASMLMSSLASISIGLANIATMGLVLILPWAYCSLYVGFSHALAQEKKEELY